LLNERECPKEKGNEAWPGSLLLKPRCQNGGKKEKTGAGWRLIPDMFQKGGKQGRGGGNMGVNLEGNWRTTLKGGEWQGELSKESEGEKGGTFHDFAAFGHLKRKSRAA